MARFRTLSALLLASTVILGGCGSDSNSVPPISTPTPTPPATSANYDVVPCVSQQVLPNRTVAGLIVPDVLTIDVNQTAGFPNGRMPDDPVIDRTLAMIFLDLTRHDINTSRAFP